MSLEDNALMQQIEFSKQVGPSNHDLKLLRHWLTSTDGNESALRGPGWNAWEKGPETKVQESEYIVLSSKHRNTDRFERWTGDTLLGLYHRLIGRHLKVSSPPPNRI